MIRYTYWYCTYYVMITLIVVGLTCLLTMYGVLFELSGTLGLSFFLYVLCWFMSFIGAIIICMYGVEESETLTNQLNEVFNGLIFRMEYDDRARRILKIIQEYVSICVPKSLSESYNTLFISFCEIFWNSIHYHVFRFVAVELMGQMIISITGNRSHGNVGIESLDQSMHMDASSLLPGTLSHGLQQ